MRERSQKAHRRLLSSGSDDPLSGIANLFDVAMVFSVALILALIARSPSASTISSENNFTVLKNPGQPNMEVIHRDGKKLKHYRISKENLTGNGERLGTAYRLENGEVVYVPKGSLSR